MGQSLVGFHYFSGNHAVSGAPLAWTNRQKLLTRRKIDTDKHLPRNNAKDTKEIRYQEIFSKAIYLLFIKYYKIGLILQSRNKNKTNKTKKVYFQKKKKKKKKIIFKKKKKKKKKS